MEVYLIRHTAVAIPKGVCYGQSDIDLADSFTDEFKVIQSKLKDISFDAVYSSSLSRCKLLASKIASDFQVDDRLMELNFGDWELQSWDEIPSSQSDAWMEDFVNVKTPNGESYIELQKRVLDFYDELLLKPHKSVALVTHGGVIRALFSFLRKIPLNKSFDVKVHYGDIWYSNKDNISLIS